MGCRACEGSDFGVVRGCYDYAFAAGGRRKPGIGAGTASLLFLRLLADLQRLDHVRVDRAEGNNLIAPALRIPVRPNKVRFEFFCRVKGPPSLARRAGRGQS